MCFERIGSGLTFFAELIERLRHALACFGNSGTSDGYFSLRKIVIGRPLMQRRWQRWQTSLSFEN